MRDFFEKYLLSIPRDGENGAGAGAGGGAAGAAAPGGAAAGQGSGAGEGAGGEGGGAGGAGGSGGGASPPQLHFPEGLPDNLKGATDQETIDRLGAAWKTFRQKESGRDVPKEAAAYLSLEGVDEKTFKPNDTFKGYADFMAKDPGMKAGLEVLHKAGVDRPVVLNALQATLGALSEAGVLEPMIDPAAERAALLPEAAKSLPKAEQDKAIDRRMEDNGAFIDLMTQNRGLDKEAADYAKLMLSDSAKGHRFFEWVRGQVQGGGQGAGAHGDGGGAGDTAESLRADLAKLEAKKGTMEYDPKAHEALLERYKKVHGKG